MKKMENRSHLENKNGESRNMAREHNTMLINTSLFCRRKLLSPEKQPESVPESIKVTVHHSSIKGLLTGGKLK